MTVLWKGRLWEVHQLESYFTMEVEGHTMLARTRIDQPGKIWVHRGCFWLPL